MSLSFPICKEETKKKKTMDFFVSPLGQNLRATTVPVDLRQVGAAEGHKENGRRGRF